MIMVFYIRIAAFERFNSYVKEFGQRSEKEQRTSYDLIAEYLVSSPECKEIFNVISNKDLYSKFEVDYDCLCNTVIFLQGLLCTCG